MTGFEKRETVRLYDNDSYDKEFTATVCCSVQSGNFFEIELDRTAFFPEGGGQPGDVGVLRLFAEGVENAETADENSGEPLVVHVLDTRIRDGVVYHRTDAPIPVGTAVCGVVDWEKRFSRMQCHSAEHIVSGLVHSMFGFDNIGFHLTDDYVICDYNGILTWKDLKKLEYEVNRAVFENIPITVEYPGADELDKIPFRSKLDFSEEDFKNGAVRLVRIGDVDCCACCAPHVHGTGEIGLVKIVNFEKSHGGTRLHLRAGFLALRDYDEKQTNILRISDLLSARQFEVADCVEQLQRSNSQLNYDLTQASKAIAAAKLDAIDNVHGNLVVHISGADTDTLRSLANGGKDKCDGIVVALTDCDGDFRYIITTSDENIKLKSLVREYNAALSGRGGGTDEMVSGVFSSTLTAIEEYFK